MDLQVVRGLVRDRNLRRSRSRQRRLESSSQRRWGHRLRCLHRGGSMSVYFYILLIVKSWHCSITSKDFSTIEKTSPLVLRQLKLKTWKKYFFLLWLEVRFYESLCLMLHQVIFIMSSIYETTWGLDSATIGLGPVVSM